MKNKERWIIAMDHTKMDNSLLQYAAGLCNHLTPEKILLVSVLKDKKSYTYLPDEYLSFMNQAEEEVKLQMKAKVDKHFEDLNINFEYLILYGNPLEEIIHLVMNQGVSLVLAGRKKQSSGSGVVSERLSRNLPCNVLIVPEKTAFKLDNILIPTDFSYHSTLALQQAIQLKEVQKKAHVYAYNGYSVPMGYSKSGKSYEEFANIMQANAKKEMNRWMKEAPFAIKPVLQLNDESPSDQIVSISKETDIDLIIMGSKGQTAASLALLGSVTLKVIARNTTIPLLIVKKPGENINFIEAMGKI